MSMRDRILGTALLSALCFTIGALLVASGYIEHHYVPEYLRGFYWTGVFFSAIGIYAGAAYFFSTNDKL